MGFWAAAAPWIVSGVAAIAGGMSGSKNKTTKNKRVGASLNAADLRGTGLQYRDFVSNYLKSKPGLSSQESGRMMKNFRRGTQVQSNTSRMRSQGYMSQRGIRGAGAAAGMGRIDENRKAANYDASVKLLLNEHAIRESDVARRAAVAAQFLWPAESARGAGQIQSVSTNNPQAALEGVAIGSRMAGSFMDSYASRQQNQIGVSGTSWANPGPRPPGHSTAGTPSW
jgi:hypothetical protein